MTPLKVTIKDVDWNIVVLEDELYTSKYGADSQGLTIKDDFLIVIRRSNLSLRLITHEIFHGYVGSCCINSVQNMDAGDMEELAAEIVEAHLTDILRTSKKLYNTFKVMLEKTNEK